MANTTNEDFFDISSLTPRIPCHELPPWQKINSAENGGNQHVVASYNNAGQIAQNINNGYENFNGGENNGIAFEGRHLGDPESALPISGSPGTQTAADNSQGENLENWDPMGSDYACPKFNCYKKFDVLASEPPKQRPQEMFAESPDTSRDISLYVANIPIQITQEGLKNLFQGAGKVHSCCVLPPNDPSRETKIGFVTFHSWKEASKAIECYDGFSLGNNVKLRVKVANKKNRQQDDYFLTKDDKCSTTENFSFDAPDTNGESFVNGFNESESAIDMNFNTVPKKIDEQVIAVNPNAPNNTSGTSGEERPCTKCGKLCTQRCSACKAPYCSRECQKADKVNHKLVCSYGNTKKPLPAASTSAPPTSAASTLKHSEQDDPMNEINFDCIDISNDVADKVQVTADHVSNEASKNASRVSTPPGVATKVFAQLPPAPTVVPNAFRLLVTTVAGGNSFWAQVINEAFYKFFGVTEQMAEVTEEALESAAEPFPGMYCLVRFSLDRCWYRSRVEQLSNDKKVEVLFVDYGNKEWKSVHELYYLPVHLSELPAQARLFTLSSVVVSQNVEVQKTMRNHVDGMVSGKMFPAELVRVVPGCNPEVVLRESGAQRTINEMVVEQQRGLESSLGGQPSPHNEMVVEQQTGLESSLGGQPSPHNEMVVEQQTGLESSLGGQPSPHNEMVVEQQTGLESSFAGKLDPHNEMVVEQQRGLESNLGGKLDPHNEMVVEQQRGLESSLGGKLDRHNEMVVEQQTGLDSSLGGHTSPQASQPIADLSLPSHSGPATAFSQSSGLPQELVTTPPFKIYMAAGVPNEVLPSENAFDICVSDISSPSLFWIQLPDTAIDKLNHLGVLLDATYKESAFAEYVPSIGELVVAKFTDDMWYRAKVDCIYNNGTLRVTFVDFGNSEDVRLWDVRRITQDLVDIPKLAIRCGLIGVERPSKAGDWSAECIDLCKRLMLNKRCTASVEGHVRDTVMLWVMGSFEPSGPGCDVNEELVRKGYAKSTEPDVAQNNVNQGNETPQKPIVAENHKHFPTEQPGAFSSSSFHPVASDNAPVAARKIEPQNSPVVGASPSTFHQKTNLFSSQNETPYRFSPTSPAVAAHGAEAPVPQPRPGESSRDQRQRRLLPQPSFPSGAFDVVVNDVTSGGVFYAQMIGPTLVRQLQKCVREVNEFCKRSPPGRSAGGDVTVGSLGCARFSLDNVWYRAQVLAVEETVYRVRFVDFGNAEIVPTADFREPSESFYDLAPQAIGCRFAGSDGGVESSGDKGKEMLVKLTRNKRLSCTVIDTQSVLYGVKLEECCGGQGIDLGKKMQDWASSLSGEINSSSRCSSTSSANSWNRSEFGELVLGPAIESAGVEGPGTQLELLVTDVAHPTYFWAQLALRSNIENLNRLTVDLNAHYNSTGYAPYEAKVNTFCACKFTLDDVWYRGFVKNDHPTKGLFVHFVDFGNSELTSVERMRPLEEQFLVEPFRAILCSMACVQPVEGKFWSADIIEYFKSKVTASVLECFVVYSSSSRLFVDIQDPASDDNEAAGADRQSLKARLVENGMAKEVGSYSFSTEKRSSVDQDEPVATNNTIGSEHSLATGRSSVHGSERNSSMQNSRSNSFNHDARAETMGDEVLQNQAQFQEKHDSKKSAPSFGDPPLTTTRSASSEPERMMASQFPHVAVDTENHVRVMVCEVCGPREIYFQVVEAEAVAGLTSLSETLNAQFHNADDSAQGYTAIPGELCCALFSADDCWYRVVVRGVDLNAGVASVHFLDYGNHDDVPFASLRPIAPSLAVLPFQARRAALAGMSPDSGAAWTQDSLAYLKTVLLERLLVGKVSRELQGLLEMEFYDTSGDEDILINALFTQQGNPAEPLPQPQPEPHHASATVIPEVIPTESDLEVIATEVNGPQCFYVHHVVPDTVQQFAAMMQQMNSFCESSRDVLAEINVGDFCCGKFACDGQWYRAKVEAFPGNGLVRVFYVDFGNREDVEPTRLQPLDQMFVRFPAQALRCALANVAPAEVAWSASAVEWLKSAILGKRLCARVVGWVGPVLQLELIDTSNPDEDVHINVKFLETGQGKMA